MRGLVQPREIGGWKTACLDLLILWGLLGISTMMLLIAFFSDKLLKVKFTLTSLC